MTEQVDFYKWPISNRQLSGKIHPMEVEQEDDGVSCCCGFLMRCVGIWTCLCPPCPSAIGAKSAFHPPQKGLYYNVYERPNYNVPIQGNDIREVADGRRLGIRLHFNEPSELLKAATAGVEAFIVKTKQGNHLVCALFSPHNITNHSTVILFSHPNSMDLGANLYPRLAYLQRLGCLVGVDVFGFDYSGYGISEGRPSEKNIYADIEAVYDKIRELRPHQKIVLVGSSMGTCSSAHMASLCPPNLAGVVMISAFTSGIPVAFHSAPTATPSCIDQFCTVKKIPLIEVPVLYIHGVLDTMIPIQHSELLLSLTRSPVHPLYIVDANHQNIFLHVDTIPRIQKFVNEELDAVVTQPGSTISSTRSTQEQKPASNYK